MMKKRRMAARLLSLSLALLMALSLSPAALASAGVGMGNFKKIRDYPGFPDVPASSWFANDVRQAYELGLVNGQTDGRFNPDGDLTVAEALTMASRVHAIYFGLDFNPDSSRTPWYADTVDYALEWGIIQEGDYKDYGVKATRSDLANLFYSIPPHEFPRTNRIAWISDVSTDDEYFNYIYLLYSAGVLTGSETGAFQPDNLVTRAEAAAIINRVVLPENRKSFSITTNAPGQVITGANGNFKLSIPKDSGWEISQNEMDDEGNCSFTCAKKTDGGTALLSMTVMPKSSMNWTTLYAYMLATLQADAFKSRGANLGEDDMSEAYIRGLSGYYAEFPCNGVEWIIFCTENSTQLYEISLANNEGCSEELIDELFEIFFTLDIAL